MKKYVTMLVVGVLTFFSLTAFKSEAFGRGRIFGRRGGCCNVVAVREVVAVQDAFAVLVPSFQFQYAPPSFAYALPATPAITYPTVQPYGYGQPYAQPYGQPYGQPYAQPYGQPYGQPYAQPYGQQFNGLNRDKIRELAQALIEEMNKQLEGGDNQPPVPQSNAAPSQPSVSPSQPQNGGNISALQYQALSTMVRSCSACHTGVGAKKGQIIFSQPGFFNPNVNLAKIKEEIQSDRMPPVDSQYSLTPLERGIILEWLRLRGV